MNEAAKHRQTAKFLRKRFAEAGIRPNTRHGQNFLIDLNILDLIVREANVGPNDLVVEVGTGTGSLTTRLAERAAHVITLEIDHQLASLAQEGLLAFDNITFLQQDALRNKNNLHPILLDAIKSKLQPGHRLKLVANLPYNVATPIISNFLLVETVPDSMTVTIQRELADRIMARERNKDYSALSVWIQSVCDVRLVRALPPSVFWPRPKVNSAIIQVNPDPDRRAQFADIRFFHQFCRRLFLHRRKFLRSGLCSMLKQDMDKPEIDAIMAQRGLSREHRAEELNLAEIQALAELIRVRLAEKQT